MINNVVLVGRMTRDAELRYTPSNVAVATFTLAVNRTFKSQNGEREADFINVVMWRQQAENLANWAKKGSLVFKLMKKRPVRVFSLIFVYERHQSHYASAFDSCCYFTLVFS